MTMYRYEMHAHSCEGSACGCSPAADLARAYAEKGYAGMVLTDHFIWGNTAVPRNLPWPQRMQGYYDAYLSAKAVGDALDFDVLFGVEHAFGDGKEALIYGIDLEFLVAHPTIPQVPFSTLSSWVREAGGFVALAHPFRQRDYIRADVTPDPAWFDGAEIYNFANNEQENAEAAEWAVKHDLTPISGADIHHCRAANLGQAGVAFTHRVRTGSELVQALKAREGRLIVHGEIV